MSSEVSGFCRQSHYLACRIGGHICDGGDLLPWEIFWVIGAGFLAESRIRAGARPSLAGGEMKGLGIFWFPRE